jgi:NAD(P)-dependent dehydrogenase (short-subunit alcohol dehydrogenase family)
MMQLYAGRVAAVTGGTQGVGEAVARALAREGAGGLGIAGRNVPRGAAVAEELTAAGCPAIFIKADLHIPEHCTRVVRDTMARFGRIDGLVNCAALNTRGTIEETTVELWDEHMAVNARAPFLTMQEAIKHMRAGGRGGAIVNIITQNAHGGQPHLVAYSASKGALATLTKNVAHAVRYDRIRVNGIMLGWTDTPNEDRIQRDAHGAGDDWLARAEAAQPMGKLGKTDEIADLVVLLLSDRGGIMTGALVDYTQRVPGCFD